MDARKAVFRHDLVSCRPKGHGGPDTVTKLDPWKARNLSPRQHGGGENRYRQSKESRDHGFNDPIRLFQIEALSQFTPGELGNLVHRDLETLESWHPDTEGPCCPGSLIPRDAGALSSLHQYKRGRRKLVTWNPSGQGISVPGSQGIRTSRLHGLLEPRDRLNEKPWPGR